ncbi:MAG TPA: sulfotransferase domain-containing protein, partial [bacterium]
IAYDTYRFRDERIVRRIIGRSSGDAVVFKPLNDAQDADRLLERYAGAKVIWIYRGYRSVVHSAIRMWQGAQRDIMLGIARDERRHPGQVPVREGMTPDMVALCRRLSDPDISAEDGAALHWYFRNLLYFERGLDRHSSVLLVKYEDLVAEPTTYFPGIFEFIGCRYSEKYVKIVQRSGLEQPAVPSLRPEIEGLCVTLMERLDSRKGLGAAGPAVSERTGRTDASRP